jgi:hypothetical protein
MKRLYPNAGGKFVKQINLSLIRGNVRVEWRYIGEGISGDYNQDNPDNIEMLRFYVSKRDSANNIWIDVDDGSYCTCMPLGTAETVLQQALEIIMDNVYASVANGISIKKIGERLSHINETLALPSQDGSVIQFTYKDNTFQPVRNLTAAESAFENIEKRTDGFRRPITIDGYSHNDFYAIATENKAVVDLYLMNGTLVVLPHSIGLLNYDGSLALHKGKLTYFSACCGKIVYSHKAEAKDGYAIEGTVEATGDFYCSRCKRDVKRTGEVKKTPQLTDNISRHFVIVDGDGGIYRTGFHGEHNRLGIDITGQWTCFGDDESAGF